MALAFRPPEFGIPCLITSGRKRSVVCRPVLPDSYLFGEIRRENPIPLLLASRTIGVTQSTIMQSSQTLNEGTSTHARRSTRVFQSVLLNVSGQNRVGNPISELTSAISVSFHGCLYSSRYDHRPESWVILEAVNQETKGKLHPVR